MPFLPQSFQTGPTPCKYAAFESVGQAGAHWTSIMLMVSEQVGKQTQVGGYHYLDHAFEELL